VSTAQLRLALLLIFAVNLIHPLIHGTPLDGGALDGAIQALDVWAMNLTPSPY
jgi:hypothetical protein